MGIEHVHTTVLIRKKTKIKLQYYFEKPLYLVYCNVSRPLTLRNIEITLLYLIVHVFILHSIYTKMPNTYQIFGEMFKLQKNVTYAVCVFWCF